MMHIAPRSLDLVPPISDMVRYWQATAAFEGIMKADPQWRVFRFEPAWLPGIAFGSFDTMQGNCIRAALSEDRAVIWGYDEECSLSGTTIAESEALGGHSPIPSVLGDYLRHTDFDCGGCTFCIWSTNAGQLWRCLRCMVDTERVANEEIQYLGILCGDMEGFAAWAIHEYEGEHRQEGFRRLVRALFESRPLTPGLLQGLSVEGTYAEIASAVRSTGYPVQESE